MGQPGWEMDKDWKKGGSMSPAEEAKLEESKRRVDEVHQEKIDAFHKRSAVKPVEDAKPYYKESK